MRNEKTVTTGRLERAMRGHERAGADIFHAIRKLLPRGGEQVTDGVKVQNGYRRHSDCDVGGTQLMVRDRNDKLVYHAITPDPGVDAISLRDFPHFHADDAETHETEYCGRLVFFRRGGWEGTVKLAAESKSDAERRSEREQRRRQRLPADPDKLALARKIGIEI